MSQEPRIKTPRKIFYTTAKGGREHFKALPGIEREQCSRCRHVLGEQEQKAKIEKRPGILTDICPRCGCESFYLFKYEVEA